MIYQMLDQALFYDSYQFHTYMCSFMFILVQLLLQDLEFFVLEKRFHLKFAYSHLVTLPTKF